MIIPNIWENKKCSKPPTRYNLYLFISKIDGGGFLRLMSQQTREKDRFCWVKTPLIDPNTLSEARCLFFASNHLLWKDVLRRQTLNDPWWICLYTESENITKISGWYMEYYGIINKAIVKIGALIQSVLIWTLHFSSLLSQIRCPCSRNELPTEATPQSLWRPVCLDKRWLVSELWAGHMVYPCIPLSIPLKRSLK